MDDIIYYESFERNGERVAKENALQYAMSHCGIMQDPEKPLDQEFTEMLEEWFFSTWCPVHQEEGERSEWL